MAEYERLAGHLKKVQLLLGEVISEAGDELRYAYFPTTSIMSTVYVLESGASTETAVVGNDGMIGVTIFTGGGAMPYRVVVRNAGYGYRLEKHLLIHEFNRAGGQSIGALKTLLLRYTQALLIQMGQTAVCNRHHSVSLQLCRSLLLSLDRLPSDNFVMTQQLLANMLGVRREGVTEAAGKLQKEGLIEYSRGRIKVLDRTRLEARACECYRVITTEYNRLLSVRNLTNVN